MKITNLGALTNFEVLDVLRSRGASSDPLAALGSVSLSECKVFDYLIQTPASVQAREDIDEFMKRCEKYRLLMAEKLHIVNFRPTCPEEIEPFIDEGVKRQEPVDAEELAHMISEVLPHPEPKKKLPLRIKLQSKYNKGKVILEAALLTLAVVVSLTLYTFWAARRGHDFNRLGPFLFSAVFILMIFSLIQITGDGMRKDHLLPPSSLIWFLNCLWQPVVDLGSTCCRGRDVDLPLPIDLRHLFRPEHHHAGADPFHVMVYLDDLAGAR